ncbi:N-acetylmuramoyl-L-alanine amidase-like domain-containing protein [Asaia sp. VD9]|uniref:N-acetylmuramoyl-L-alanine amidase-like domain-containing protein n=1 Tax=Asaia sp. VD9 TaxID=3081235 RepID=UPI003018512E
MEKRRVAPWGTLGIGALLLAGLGAGAAPVMAAPGQVSAASIGFTLPAERVFSPADQARVDRIEQEMAPVHDFTKRLDQISAGFLGTPYQADTLIGSADTPEKLVVRFEGVDCYTFIDQVRALALGHDRRGFLEALVGTRYRGGHVAYLDRRHFLTDWVAYAPNNARDITSDLSSGVRVTHKILNQRKDGGVYIRGLSPHARDIAYLPPEALTPEVAAKIHTGDVIGIYTALDGLDVTHTGLAIWKDHTLYFRNASSLKANRKVVDTELGSYIQGKPGILVLRMIEGE